MRRRHFLVLSATSIGGILVYSLERNVSRVFAQGKPAPDKQIRIPLRFFTQDEALIVAAATSRIFPSDDSGPGAREAGVVIFIDRQLAGPWARDQHRYTHEPFDAGAAPEFGYQGAAPPQQIYRTGLKQLAGFDQMTPSEQDEKLRQIENSLFLRCCGETR